MNNLILATTVLLMSASASAFGGATAINNGRVPAPKIATLPEGSVALISIAGEVTSTAPLCPKGVTCITNGTIINLNFLGNGCLDDLLPLVYDVVGDEVVVHAQIALNEKSKAAMCTAIPMFQEQITLVNEYPSKIRFLGTRVVSDLK